MIKDGGVIVAVMALPGARTSKCALDPAMKWDFFRNIATPPCESACAPLLQHGDPLESLKKCEPDMDLKVASISSSQECVSCKKTAALILMYDVALVTFLERISGSWP